MFFILEIFDRSCDEKACPRKGHEVTNEKAEQGQLERLLSFETFS